MLDDTVLDYKTPLYVLFAATGCVLLIACLNVAGLLVARAAARSKELAIRAALGGGRLQLLRESSQRVCLSPPQVARWVWFWRGRHCNGS